MEVRVGLIGCGNMGSGLLRNCAQVENAKVAAVADPVAENVKKLADELDVPAFDDYRKMLAKDDIDAVIVAVPNFLHAAVSIDVAESSKHVFCEKPMAMTVSDCDRMIQTAKANGVKLMVGQVLRYLPVFAKIKEIIDSGVLGEPSFTGIIHDCAPELPGPPKLSQ